MAVETVLRICRCKAACIWPVSSPRIPQNCAAVRSVDAVFERRKVQWSDKVKQSLEMFRCLIALCRGNRAVLCAVLISRSRSSDD